MQQSHNSIGVVSHVYSYKLVMEIHDTSRINYNFNGDLYVCEGINTFVCVYKSYHHKFIYQIISLSENEKPFDRIGEESRFSNKAFFEAVPVGEIKNGEFKYGLSKFPMIGDDVFLTSNADMNSVFNSMDPDFSIALGPLSSFDSFSPMFSIDKILTNHMSILGNTGSGKSTTVRKLLNEISNTIKNSKRDINSANFLIFDIHDEYASIQKDNSFTVDVNDLSIPLDTLSLEDWINLVQPSSAVQLPILMSGLRLANLLENNENGICDWVKVYCALELYNNVQTEVLGKRTKIIALLQDIGDTRITESLTHYSSQYGNFQSTHEQRFKENLHEYIKEKSRHEYSQCKELISSLLEKADCKLSQLTNLEVGLELTFLFEESKGNSQIRSYCATLMTRITNIIGTYSRSLFEDTPEKRKKFTELLDFNKGFTIMKVSQLDDNDLLFFTGYILRMIYLRQKANRISDDNSNTIKEIFHFIFDEAHKYITETNIENIKSIRIFEQIAKEGRKFGIFMILASQRPSDISKTVLSQCNNFILHRIRNNLDIEQMRKSIPYLSDSQLTRISYLTTGAALLVGDAFAIPMEIIIDGSEYGLASRTNLPSEVWRTIE